MPRSRTYSYINFDDPDADGITGTFGRGINNDGQIVGALEARGKGLLGTLRYPYEVRNEKEYFDDVVEPKITKDMLDLATHIVETKTGDFDPKKFEDQYEDAVKELLKKKQHGEKIEAPKERGEGRQSYGRAAAKS